MATFFCQGQNPQKVQQLQHRFDTAATDAGRIAALGALAGHYYAYRLEKQADSILQLQLSLAQLSHNK
ncbi:MAG TPA: hypothetical protein VM010_04995, partial [Chitinophagaceae bacterium]|nr:hypothetical protein [Chitinophagaceae bacterium]